MAQLPTVSGSLTDAERNNNISTFESILSGIGSGLISIPKGAFSLGATLYDLGAGTDKAAQVEKFFDDLTELDEKAEATTAGKITEALVNLGVPGVYGFKLGSNLAKAAIESKKAGTYFKLNNPALRQATDKAVELNTKGKLLQFGAGALGGGLSDAAFVGDVKDIGTIGDLLGGPTELDRDEDGYDPAKELINRLKFGAEGILLSGIIGGTGSTIQALAKRGKDLRYTNSRIDKLLDNIASGFRARGKSTEEVFQLRQQELGLLGRDVDLAKEVSKTLDQDIDSIFPAWKTIANKQTAQQRKESLEKLNELLLSGKPEVNEQGRVIFGAMDDNLKTNIVNQLEKYGAKKETIDNIINNLNSIRLGWGDLFSTIGTKLDDKSLNEFKNLFGEKFKNYLGSSYQIFQDKSIIPLLNYKPAAEVVEKAKQSFKDIALKNGRQLTDNEAEYYVNNVVSTAKLPKGFRIDQPSDPLFKAPDFFLGKTIADDAIKPNGEIYLSALPQQEKQVIEDLLGKSKNPVQTILSGTAKLSMITRRNELFDNLLNKSDELINNGQRGIFYKSEADAITNFPTAEIKQIKIDPSRKFEAGITNPLEGLYTTREIADSLTDAAQNTRSDSLIGKLYENLILYPKATSQIAKTVLSPVTHVKNFISAGAFATANGILPTPELAKKAYQALSNPETRREFIELGIANTNVRLGDLQNLMKDVGFGETVNSEKVLRMMLKPFSKIKDVAEDLYTKEDDFWKILSFYAERDRLEKSYLKYGIDKTAKELSTEASEIIKNNIPNYAYVGDFVKSLRRLPIGNFASFPAEILRTGTNIVKRAIDEITYTVTLPDGRVVKPLAETGYKRLIGMATTTAVIPTATVEAAKVIYDVAEDEIDAIRRFVPKWSKNSTIIPIRDKETGELKYVDFSRINAYDTLTRPIQTVINAVAEGREDKDGIMNDFLRGLITSSKELAQPFIDESIWTEALTDLIARNGKTAEGIEIYNPADTYGNKVAASIQHLVKTQAPLSYSQLKRLDLAIKPIDIIEKGEFDKFGQTYELGDELAGLAGFRAIKLNVPKSLAFKVRDFNDNVDASRRLFTRETLRGGPVTPEEIIDSYINANRSLYSTKSELYKDLKAADALNIKEEDKRRVTDRLSRREYGNITNGIFTPLELSKDVINLFEENAVKLGLPNPYLAASNEIERIKQELSKTSLKEGLFPKIENPFKNLPEPTLSPIQGLPILPNPTNIQNYGQLPNAITKLTPVEQALLSPTEQLIRQRQRTV
jgi:hypothetical protein